MQLYGPALLLMSILFVWMWWTLPGRRIPKDVTKDELARLEAEDKIRQTVGQLFAGIALVATFALTIYQTFQSSRQWSSDHQLNQRTEALKAIGTKDNPTAHVAGIYALFGLAKNDDNIRTEVIDILVTHVRSLAVTDIVKPSKECGTPDAASNARESSDPEVQAAMNALGGLQVGSVSQNANSAFHLGSLRLDHLFLDDLDLGDADYSNADMSQSHFRRVNFRNATLRRVNFGGTDMADFDVAGFPTNRTANWLYGDSNGGGVAEWQRYRCWVADFRGAHLEGATLTGSGLTGADFSRATFDKDTNLSTANIGRANFTGAVGLAKSQLEAACADEPVLNDLDAQIKACHR